MLPPGRDWVMRHRAVPVAASFQPDLAVKCTKAPSGDVKPPWCPVACNTAIENVFKDFDDGECS